MDIQTQSKTRIIPIAGRRVFPDISSSPKADGKSGDVSQAQASAVEPHRFAKRYKAYHFGWGTHYVASPSLNAENSEPDNQIEPDGSTPPGYDSTDDAYHTTDFEDNEEYEESLSASSSGSVQALSDPPPETTRQYPKLREDQLPSPRRTDSGISILRANPGSPQPVTQAADEPRGATHTTRLVSSKRETGSEAVHGRWSGPPRLCTAILPSTNRVTNHPTIIDGRWPAKNVLDPAGSKASDLTDVFEGNSYAW